MAEIKWIKLSVNMFDDEKIKLIRTMPEGDSIIIIWVQILCLAGKNNDGGLVYMGQNLAYTDEMLATILGHSLNIMRVALQTLQQFGMIEVNKDGTIDVLNWEKHQNIDGMERIRKQNRERKKRFDLRKKLEQLGYDPNDENVPHKVDKLEKYVMIIEERSNSNVTLPDVTKINKNVTNDQGSLNDNNKGSNVTLTSSNATDKTRIEEEKKREDKKEINTTTTEGKEKNGGSSGEKLPSKNVFGAWEKLWMFPNLVQKEVLVELSERYSDELVVAAIKIAGVNSVIKGRAINFIEAVLKEWEDNNVETIEQAREYTKNRNKVKNKSQFNNKKARKHETLPDWAKEDYNAEKKEDDQGVPESIDWETRRKELQKVVDQRRRGQEND